MLQSDTATIGGVITDNQIHSLPISGRDFTNLLATSAGVAQPAGGIQATISNPQRLNTQFTSLSLGGARPASISYIIDRVTDTTPSLGSPGHEPQRRLTPVMSEARPLEEFLSALPTGGSVRVIFPQIPMLAEEIRSGRCARRAKAIPSAHSLERKHRDIYGRRVS